jgi:hypothetical protein
MYVKSFLMIATIPLVMLCLLQCNIKDRLSVIEVIKEAKEIRDAQQQMKINSGRYGTLDELEETGLYNRGLLNSAAFDYVVELNVQEDHYDLIIKPTKVPTSEESLILYVDESGVIRACLDPTKPVNVTCEPIADQ